MPLELAVVDAALKSVETVKADLADIGFFAIDPRCGHGIAFTAPYLLIEGAYLVRQESRFTDNAQVDSTGTRIMVRRGSSARALLAGFVKQAKASGLVAQSLARHNIRGAVLVPASR